MSSALSRRNFVLGTALLPLSGFTAHAAAPTQQGFALSMLAQRCAKAYAQTALNVQPEQSKVVMQQSQRGMSSSLTWLRGQPYERFELQRELKRFDTLLTAAPARKILLAVSHQSNVLQDAAEREHEPNALMALSTLSQRMAKNYFLLAYGIDQADARLQLYMDQRAFKLALQAAAQRTSSKPNSIDTSRTSRALEQVQAQWLFYEAALQSPQLSSSQLHVASSSERLWELLHPLWA